jgi:hypothetical protein
MNPTGWIVYAVTTALIGLAIGKPKGHPWWGLALGLLLNVIGLVVLIFIRPSREAEVRKAIIRLTAEAEARRRLDAEDKIKRTLADAGITTGPAVFTPLKGA